jgi:serine/threonine protein kinase
MKIKLIYVSAIFLLFFLPLLCFGQSDILNQVLKIKSLETNFNLEVKWKYQQGDDLTWANPEFDDSAWAYYQIDKPPEQQAIKPINDFSWFRIKLQLPNKLSEQNFNSEVIYNDLAIALQTKTFLNYQIYANGVLITPQKDILSVSKLEYPWPKIIQIPSNLIDSNGNLSLAIRVWFFPENTVGSGRRAFSEGLFLLGKIPNLEIAKENRRIKLLYVTSSTFVLSIIFLLVSLYHLLIYLRLGTEKDYLRYSLCVFFYSIQIFAGTFFWNSLLLGSHNNIILVLFISNKLTSVFLIEFLWNFFNKPISKWVRAFQLLNLVNVLCCLSLPYLLTLRVETFTYAPFSILFLVMIIKLIAMESWRGNSEAKVLLLGTIVYFLVFLVQIKLTYNIIQWAFAFNIVLMATLVANRFARVYKELNILNRNLENKVSERTNEISQKNKALQEQTNEIGEKNKALQDRIEEIARKNQELVESNQRADRIFNVLAEALPGTVLDEKYRLDEMIGSGGFGAVYKATHLQIKRKVAVKIFKPSAGNDSSESLERFRLEAIAGSRINHPNAVAIVDSGISSDGIAYLVMELLNGRPLKKEIREKKVFSVSRMVFILLPVCEVLIKAHELGLVHRDIKPDNIFIHHSEGKEIIKLVDFGLVKLVEDSGSINISDLTATGVLIGSPQYMSPEQVNSKACGEKSDIYSLGVVAYEMLAGRLPFLPINNVMFSLFMQHMSEPPPHLTDFNKNVPEELVELIMQTLAKKPDERPSAQELATAMSKFYTEEAAETYENITQEQNDDLTDSKKTKVLEPDTNKFIC